MTSGGRAATAGRQVLANAFAVACVGFALFHLYTSLTGPFDPLVQRGVFIGGGLLLAFWMDVLASKRWAARGLYLGLGLAGLYGGVHVIANQAYFMNVMNDMRPGDMAVALLFGIAILVATRRMLGWALPVLATVAVVYYALANGWMTGMWQPPITSFGTVVSTLYASTMGVFGFMADIGTSVIAVYVVFGALLMATGAGDVFVQVAQLIAGRGHGGPAKVAVITSALFGTVSGSAVANVMAVGSLTIPTMERSGYPRALAAGVEAAASAGGQIMPPIMGAGAFLMAELLNVSYLTIVLAATLPAMLYFLVIFTSVDLYARRHNLGADESSVRVKIEYDKAIPLAVAVITLIGALVANFTPTFAGVVAIGSLLAASAVCRIIPALLGGISELSRVRVREFLVCVWQGLAAGGRGLIMISVLLACAGILASVLTASGLSSKMSSELIDLAGGSLVAALFLAAVLCVLLGMDVPTTASYVLTAAVAAPLLTKFGLPPLTAHLFIFYFAILSAITPPVCASVYAAAAIAGERFWTVSRYAMIMAGPVYVIPFMLVYRPGLLLQGGPPTIAYDFVVTCVAVLAVCAAMIGYLSGSLRPLARVGLFVAGSLFFFPGVIFDVSGALLFVAILLLEGLGRRRRGRIASAQTRQP